MEQAIEKAKSDESKTEVVIDASTDTTSAPGVAQSELTLAKESMQAVANANKAIRIKTDTGQLTFSPKAAESIGKADGGERLVIETEKKDAVTIGSESKAAAVFTVTAKLVKNSADASSAGTRVTSFGGGVVTVALDLPGSLQQVKDKGDIGCWHYDLEKKNYSTVDGKVSEDGKQYVFTTTHFSDYIVATEDTLETFAEENTLSEGITVRGTVTSYNPGNATTVQLKQGDNVKYTTTIDAESGSGQVKQNFSLANVTAGTYDLVVTKPGHLTYTIKSVVVGSEDINLTVATGKTYQTITLLAGDVNSDGSITEDDVSVIRYSTNINKATTSAADKLADVNGDGSVTEDDVSVVRYSTHINKGTANCTYQF